MSLEARQKILGLLYEQWFKNYLVGLSLHRLVELLGLEQNDVSQYVEILQSMALIQQNNIGWYIITINGIDTHEENLPPSLISHKKQERKMILETLRPLYNLDIHNLMCNEELAKLIGINDPNYLLAVVRYLENKELIHLEKFTRGNFYIRLSALGFQSLQDLTTDNAVVMSTAYRILFSLENRFRQFIESRMRSKNGSEWWNKCISHGIKRKVDQKRQDELSLGWKVSTWLSGGQEF